MSETSATTNHRQSTSGSVETRDGTRIQYALHGGGHPKRIVLIHSLAMTNSFWDAVASRLADAADVLVYDCRGHGASDKPDAPYTVELFADDLADVMDAVGWNSAFVAGASMGGCVTLAFAAAYPERVEGLGLIDTTAHYGDDAPEQWAGRAQKALEGGLGALVDFQKTRWFGDTFRENNPAIVQDAVDVFLANDPKAYARTCHMLGACDKRATLPQIRVPVRILVGEEDYATPVAMAEAMKAAIPTAQLHILPSKRHLTPLEAPDSVAGELRQLMQETSR
ncbi:3-oxoadipate enol-lactonase [Rhodoligotrophos appendicifer]|uniref:alpha/beta fold hydrolase n=1 Tax=Rhodoligotrophos appendicifer TaxID=987056 RepID=UPI00117D370E|nr:alpha/beta fold hydrolase [Rhodoligotrophos appendicifer]